MRCLPLYQPSPAVQLSCAACQRAAGTACRRDFLRETGAAAAAVLAALTGAPAPAAALRIDFTSALRILGGEAVYPIPPQDSATVDRDNGVILARYQQVVYGFALWCPHQHTPLRWFPDEHRFLCPKHKTTFQPDGTLIEGRANRDMDRYPLRRDGSTVVVDLATVYQQDKDREKWAAAVVRL